MRCKARSQAYAFDWPRWKRETVHVATLVSSTIGTTTIPHAFSHCAKVRSSAMINRWIWDFFHDTTMTDFYCDDTSRVTVRCSRSIRLLKPLGRCRSHSAPARWPASRSLRRRSPYGPERGVDYSIALVKRLSAFFIMLIGFEWVCPR